MKKVIKISKPGVNSFVITFDKEGQEIELLGIVDARQKGEYELTIIAEHRMPLTRGRVTVRVVVGAEARVKIKGLIKITKNAQQTDDFLELRALTLDKNASVTLDPELEIEANNVKASHAASVGPIDPEQTLYLMSRGLNRSEAERQIVEGWLAS